MNEFDDDASRKLDEAIRAFAEACRLERDRIALTELDALDRRCEGDSAARREADREVAALLRRIGGG
jgi:hypothetical protein